MGRVRSIDRVFYRKNGRSYRHTGRVLKTGTRGPYGHRAVNLCSTDCRPRTVAVHRLVLEAFVGPCPPGMECCHNNGVASDNRLCNLRWDTSSENKYDWVRSGTHHQANKLCCPRDHRLVTPNLVKATMERGRRDCLACNRARSAARRAKRRGVQFDFNVSADIYYTSIMSELFMQAAWSKVSTF